MVFLVVAKCLEDFPIRNHGAKIISVKCSSFKVCGQLSAGVLSTDLSPFTFLNLSEMAGGICG